MSKLIASSKYVIISNESGFIYYQTGSNNSKYINLLNLKDKSDIDPDSNINNHSEENESIDTDKISENQNAKQENKQKPIDKDLKIDFICASLSNDETLFSIQCNNKMVYVFETNTWNILYKKQLNRGASKIIFSNNNKDIIVADKTGDVYVYDITKEKNKDGTLEDNKVPTQNKEVPLLGHLSMILDILMTDKFIITCDRDEKIRVSNYPNCYNIENYCLGHTQYVNNIKLLPHNDNLLLSTSGDGKIILWNYLNGDIIDKYDFNKDVTQLTHQIDDVDKNQIKNLTTHKINENESLVCLTIFNVDKVFVLKVKDNQIEFVNTISLTYNPLDIQLADGVELDKPLADSDINLWILGDKIIQLYKWNENSFTCLKNHKDLSNIEKNLKYIKNNGNTENIIYVLKKRKMDEVNDYYERKKLRVEEKNKTKKFIALSKH